MEFRHVHVRWYGNNSQHYDGRVEDIRMDDIVERDREGLCVGHTVRVQCGYRVWTGKVLELLATHTPFAQALPLTQNAGKSLQPDPVHAPQDIHKPEGTYKIGIMYGTK